MADTEYDVNISHNLDEYAAKIKAANELWDEHFAKIKAINSELAKMSIKSAGGGPSGAPSEFGNSTDRANQRRYYSDFNIYQKDFHQFSTLAKSTAGGIGGGLLSMATGGGLAGFARGFSDLGRQMQQMRSGGSLASTILGGAALGSASRPRAVAGAVAAEAEGIEGAIAKGAEQGIGFGLIQAFGKLPSIVKFGIGTALAGIGFDIYGVDKSMRDVYSRSRRAGGYGANLGQLTAFDNTMGRFVDTDSVMAAMGQAKYDFTSPAYLAAKIAGIDPKKWSDPAAMAEGSILSVQRQLKTFAPEKMLTLSHTRRFQDLGLSDQDLIRLYTGDQKEVNRLVQKAQGAAPGLDQSDELQKKYKDLSTDVDLAGARLRVMGEDILSGQIPAFERLTGVIDDLTEKYRMSPDSKPGAVVPVGARSPVPYSELGPSFWNGDFGSTPGGKYAKPGAGYGPGRGTSLSPKGTSLDPLYVKPVSNIIDGDLGPGMPGGTGWQPNIFAPQGTTPGGKFAAPGAGYGPGRSAGGDSYPGRINMPAIGGRAGRGGSAGFGLYATDIGLAASKGTSPEERAFLDTVGTGETPRGSYSNVDHDPGGLGGRYQFLRSTWVTEARKAGVDPGNFSPENQDKVAVFYANELTKQRTGKSLRALLGAGPEGAREAITAMHGVWNGIFNVDRDKSGHSGAVQLFMKKLKDEQAVIEAKKPMVNFGTLDDAEKAKEKAAAGPRSMNSLKTFQHESGLHIRVQNPAGASVNVQTAMLGATKGNFA